VKRSTLSRLGAAVTGILLLSPLVACTPPAPPKITAAFGQPVLPAPGAGILAGENADFTYRASGVPSGGRIFLQKASLSGATVRWSNVSQLNVKALGTGTIIRPPFGVSTYRLGIFDAHGKGLASAPLPLNVYKGFSYSDLTKRNEETLNYGQGKTFNWVFQGTIDIDNTSCRLLAPLQIFNSAFRAGQFEFTQTINGKTTTATTAIAANNFEANPPQTLFPNSQLLTLGEEFVLHIVDSQPNSTAIYGGNGLALCLTDTGSF
jgi:hypothetical protein